uniref:non-specific serine/threonine protein kinase n=1 Tax=Saccoglossus kowalevskii TaxID=10224 RepID=A0ABM0LW38_SACKO|nr:PREDICTED: uncharacterized protein LOC102806379 [Saccoglossus kowalevskii]
MAKTNLQSKGYAKKLTEYEFVGVTHLMLDAMTPFTQDSQELVSAFSILGLKPVTFLSEQELETLGNDTIELLMEHYKCDKHNEGCGDSMVCKNDINIVDSKNTVAEWTQTQLKQLVLIQQYPVANFSMFIKEFLDLLNVLKQSRMEAEHVAKHTDELNAALRKEGLKIRNPPTSGDGSCECRSPGHEIELGPIYSKYDVWGDQIVLTVVVAIINTVIKLVSPTFTRVIRPPESGTDTVYLGCHEAGVVHEDENILVELETNKLKIIDFGSCLLAETTINDFDFPSGTRVYSPPEWITSRRYFARSATVWSLGILLFNMAFERDDGICKAEVSFRGTVSQPLQDLIK